MVVSQSVVNRLFPGQDALGQALSVGGCLELFADPVYEQTAMNVHVGSATTGMKDRSRPMPRFWFDSRKHYFQKHHGGTYLRASNVAWASGHLLWQVRKVLQRKPDHHPPGLLRDFVKHNFLSRGRSKAS